MVKTSPVASFRTSIVVVVVNYDQQLRQTASIFAAAQNLFCSFLQILHVIHDVTSVSLAAFI
jgi:hypothetical protein